jgi:hypothetical protein
MLPQHRFPSLLIAFGTTSLVAGLILPETYLVARAGPVPAAAARSQELSVLPPLPEYVAMPAPENVVVTRDPFAGGPGGMPFPANSGPADTWATSGRGADSAADYAAPPAAALLLATALGEHPCALVSEAGSVRVVRVGDRVAGSSVREIRLGAISLDDGTALRIGAP